MDFILLFCNCFDIKTKICLKFPFWTFLEELAFKECVAVSINICPWSNPFQVYILASQHPYWDPTHETETLFLYYSIKTATHSFSFLSACSANHISPFPTPLFGLTWYHDQKVKFKPSGSVHFLSDTGGGWIFWRPEKITRPPPSNLKQKITCPPLRQHKKIYRSPFKFTHLRCHINDKHSLKCLHLRLFSTAEKCF